MCDVFFIFLREKSIILSLKTANFVLNFFTMKARILVIGDEILSGRTFDTNSNFMSKNLDSIGILTDKIEVIHDDAKIIQNELEKAFNSDASFIFTTGGLGPTKDDKTKQVITDFLEDELIFHQATYDYIESFYIKNGRKMNELTKNQALVPSKSEVIVNRYGTAPILWTEKDGKVLINLPGVPYETEAMFTEFILPKIKNNYHLPYIYRQFVVVINHSESDLALKIADWENQLPENISLAYLPAGGRITLRLSAFGKDYFSLESKVKEEFNLLKELLGNSLIFKEDKPLEKLLGEILSKEKLTLSVAESLTGGNISRKITSVSGSSVYYLGGITSYAEKIKEKILQIPSEIIKKNTVVSAEVAKEMAKNCAELFQTDIALSTTGVAGPSSDSYGNPVGLAYVGLYFRGKAMAQEYNFPNLTRGEMITRITNRALELLYNKLVNE